MKCTTSTNKKDESNLRVWDVFKVIMSESWTPFRLKANVQSTCVSICAPLFVGIIGNKCKKLEISILFSNGHKFIIGLKNLKAMYVGYRLPVPAVLCCTMLDKMSNHEHPHKRRDYLTMQYIK